MTDPKCPQELCPNWPGEGCVRGVADCPPLPDCAECAAEMHRDPLLAEAAYSGPLQMIRELITEFHRSGHAAL